MAAADQNDIFIGVPYRFDAVSPYEGIYYLLKKSFGYPNTTPQGPLLSETTNNFNAYPFVTIDKQYNQVIPLSNQNDFILDPSFSNYGFRSQRFPNGFKTDNTSKRYYSQKYPYIALYSNLVLTPIGNDPVNIPQFSYSQQLTSYAHPLLVNSIPITYDPYNSYTWKLQTSNGVEIDPSDGYWLCDTDSGVITFYDSNTTITQLSSTNIPVFTFYRYEGLIGTTNVATTQDL